MEPDEDGLVPLGVRVTRDQRRWLEAAAARSGESPDALVRQAIQILRRISVYQVPAARRFSRRT